MMFLCITAVPLRQLSVGAFLRINTVVILLGDVIRGNPWVVHGGVYGWKEVCGRLRFNEGNVILVAYGNCKCGLTPAIVSGEDISRKRRSLLKCVTVVNGGVLLK